MLNSLPAGVHGSGGVRVGKPRSVAVRETPLGSAIASIRRRLGKSQSAFSLLVSGTPFANPVSTWESGQFVPRRSSLISLLKLAATPEERAPIVDALKPKKAVEVIDSLPVCGNGTAPGQSPEIPDNRTDVEKISRTVRSLRKRLNLTQTELGQRVSVSKDMIYRYEAGLFKPSPYTLLLLWRLAQTEDELRAFSGGLVNIVRKGEHDAQR
jgi:transcriptional regulator with XRE-family HTH domain